MEIGVDSLTPNTITNSDVNANAGLIFLIGGGPEPWDRVRDDNVGSLQGVTNLNTNEERWATGARDPGHRLSQFNVDNTSYAVEHDAAGRTTRSLDFNLDYDPLNKLAGAYSIIDDTPVELYAYDAQGRLSVVSQFTSSYNPFTGEFEATLANSESIGHDGNRMVVSMNDTGFVNWLTFVGPLQDQILEYHTSDFPIIPILDHRNNVVGAWDMVQAKMLEIADYNAEGRASLFDTDEALLCNEIGNAGVNCQAPGGMPFAFNGRWRSSTTGFVNMNHRWYSPRMGEFLSHDPMLYVDSYNLFGFATYDPINGYDPFGLKQTSFFAGVGDALVEVVKSEIEQNARCGSMASAYGAACRALGVGMTMLDEAKKGKTPTDKLLNIVNVLNPADEAFIETQKAFNAYAQGDQYNTGRAATNAFIATVGYTTIAAGGLKAARWKPTLKVPQSPAPAWKGPADYSALVDHRTVGRGKKFTQSAKKKIRAVNREHNDGILRSDATGAILDKPVKQLAGVKANMKQAEVDHIFPKSKGGTNSFRNARVLSKKENMAKSDTILK